MVLGAGEAQVPVIKECKKLHLNTIVVDYSKSAPGFQYADEKLFISTNEKDEVLEAAKKYKINGILTTSDYPVRVVAYVCSELGLNGLQSRSAEIATNKFLLRECLKKNNIVVPQYFKISNVHEIDNLKGKLKFPLIIKPVDSSASRGVKKIETQSDLQQSFHETQHYSKSGDVIVEDFVEGREYSVEALTAFGITQIVAITEKTTKGETSSYYVEDRHVIPANVKDEDLQNIKSMVLQAIQATGINNSASHTEIMLSPNGPVIIEIGARLGGDYITSDLVPLATGVNMLENIINIATGRQIKTEYSKTYFSGVQFINSQNYKAATNHIEQNKGKKGFIRYEVKPYADQDLKNSLDRLGYYICVEETRKGLNELLDY